MITGKAFFIVERIKDRFDYPKFEVEVHLKTSTAETRDYVREDLLCVGKMDPPCTNLKVGERAWCVVSYQLNYHRYEDHYYGGWDVDVELTYRKIKVLKRSKPR